MIRKKRKVWFTFKGFATYLSFGALLDYIKTKKLMFTPLPHGPLAFLYSAKVFYWILTQENNVFAANYERSKIHDYNLIEHNIRINV